jgi:hypothetical protein
LVLDERQRAMQNLVKRAFSEGKKKGLNEFVIEEIIHNSSQAREFGITLDELTTAVKSSLKESIELKKRKSQEPIVFQKLKAKFKRK